MTPAFWQTIFQIADGTETRTEDDRLICNHFLCNKPLGQYWAAGEDAPTDQLMWSSADNRGYAVRTVKDVCDRIVHQRNVVESDFRKGQLLIPLRGRDSGVIFESWPSAHYFEYADVDAHTLMNEVESGIDDLPDSDDSEEAEPQEPSFEEAMILTCEDPDFLQRQLHDSYHDIIAASMGSQSRSIVPRHVIENLKVFWPPKHERSAIQLAIARTLDLAELERSEVINQINELAAEVHVLLHSAYCDINNRTTSPFYYTQQWSVVQHQMDRLQSTMAKTAGALWRDEVRRPPVTIGHLGRRILAADERAEQINLHFELAETILRHHAYVCLAVLAHEDRGALGAFLSTWFEGRATWMGSMGHWIAAGKAVANTIAKRESVSPLVQPIVTAIVAADNDTLQATADAAVQYRNRKAHGYNPTGSAAGEQEQKITKLAESLKGALHYVWERTLVFVNGRRREPASTWLNVRYLMGDNEVVERGDLQVDDATANTAYDGLVHLLTGRGFRMLTLHPWMIYRQNRPGTSEVLWLFDGFDAQTVRYCSPMRPGETLEASDMLPVLQNLING